MQIIFSLKQKEAILVAKKCRKQKEAILVAEKCRKQKEVFRSKKKKEAKRSILCSQYTASEKQKEAFFGSISIHEPERSQRYLARSKKKQNFKSKNMLTIIVVIYQSKILMLVDWLLISTHEPSDWTCR